HYLLVIAAITHIAGTFTYVRNTLLGRTQPNRVTFFLWGVIPMIAVAAGISEGAWWALLPVFMSGVGPLLTFFASFVNRKAYWKLGTIDLVCGGLAVLAIILWQITDEPMLAVVCAILADGLATYPTLLKAWRQPGTETGVIYIIALVESIIGLFALSAFTFSEYGFLLYLVLINVLLSFAVYRSDPLKKLKAEFAR
ncbi:MAG: hypothetical protein AAB923_00360, partial [Patescibacteria group bacterium]